MSMCTWKYNVTYLANNKNFSENECYVTPHMTVTITDSGGGDQKPLVIVININLYCLYVSAYVQFRCHYANVIAILQYRE